MTDVTVSETIVGALQIPDDLVEGYGYPQLTEQPKRRILGLNLLRLHGMDLDETKQHLGLN